MQNLKSFLICEELSQGNAERYVNFTEKYHTEVVLDIKKNLEEVWNKAISSLKKDLKVSPEKVQDAQFRNPKANVELALIVNSEKLSTPRAREPLEVTTSVKIPHVYNVEERQLIIRKLIKSGYEAFQKSANDWREILNYEKRGRITPWFKIVSDYEEVRFQLASSSQGEESYKTIYAIRLENGKNGSKLKDFDRIYFVTLK